MTTPLPRDGFEDYFFHKLKAWIPETYWTDDHGDGSLDLLVRTIADVAAVMRRDIDRVWTASSIDLADDWAVDYLGDLVGATPLSAQNARANRTSVANMMQYNRRKTTRYLLDQLIGDILGTDGYVREIERWLARPPHPLDMGYGRRAPLSGGWVAGLPHLTGLRTDDAALPAFDEWARLPDFGPRQGKAASFDYATIHLNVFPVETYRIDMASPFWLDTTQLTLDPSGRDIALFHAGSFDHRLGDWPRGPEEFPTPMRCARFNDAGFMITEAGLAAIDDPDLTTALGPWSGITFASDTDFRRIVRDRLSVADFGIFWGDLLREMVQPAAPKLRQIADDLLLDIGPFADARALHPYQLVAANLAGWMPPARWPDQAALLVDVTTGRVQFPAALDPVGPPPQRFHPRYHHIGTLHRVGAGPFPRGSGVPAGPPVIDANSEVSVTVPASGTAILADNRRHVWQWDPVMRSHNVAGDLRLEAADQTRPYLVSRGPAGGLDFTIFGTEGQPNNLIIDGIWLGIMAEAALTTALVNPEDPFPVPPARLILDGTFDSVTLRHVSIDPGGQQARLDPLIARPIPAITTEIEGAIRSLRIERSIIGPLIETRNDPSLLNAGVIRIAESIICSITEDVPALSTDLSRVFIDNSTVFGAVHANLIHATNTIFDGPLYVTNRQQSCLRFSAVADYTDVTGIAPSALPRRFECKTFAGRLPRTTFQSRSFGDPYFAALSDLADAACTTGGEYGTEMGVGHARAWNQRRADLARFAARFLPVGQNIQIYEDTGEPR
ncbi:hypothetical protein [Yoonia vestfoldensis]|uniref:hypothetical protein n=1 Tax=Yoonia vestfoldensis TaxID=245188 RepID=UPI000373D436|nr:hypothetical protein [Yoonia vestfoldensis]